MGRIVALENSEMASPEEKLHILKMIQDGKITPDQGIDLLNNLEKGNGLPDQGRMQNLTRKPGKPRWLRVVVYDLIGQREKINIRLPIQVIESGLKLGARFSTISRGYSPDLIRQALKAGQIGRITDVSDNEIGERIVISLE